jgi:hypothetical protein
LLADRFASQPRAVALLLAITALAGAAAVTAAVELT